MKPQIPLDYNSTKGGVDNLDKITVTYSYQCMTGCWPLVIFYNIVAVSVMLSVSFGLKSISNVMRVNCIDDNFLGGAWQTLITPKIQRHLPWTPAAAAVVQRFQAEWSRPASSQTMDLVNTGDGKKMKKMSSMPPWQSRKTTTACVTCRKYICRKYRLILCSSYGEKGENYFDKKGEMMSKAPN